MSEKVGVFASLKDIGLFNQFCLEQDVAAWLGGINLAPDAMHDSHGK